MTTYTTTGPGAYARSVEAVERTRNGADLWDIADALLAEVGQGEARIKFEAVRSACDAAGVDPYSVSALRQYRDVSAHWPPASRLPGVSFSAHRAALPADDPGALLRDLVQTHGRKVTVKAVTEAAKVSRFGAAAVSAPSAPDDLGSASPVSLVRELADRMRGRARVTGSKSKYVPDTVAADIAGAGKTADALEALRVLVSALEDGERAKSAKASAWSGSAPAAPASDKSKSKSKSAPGRKRLRG